ncbi:hypothetical protein [Niastella sp. OAS944]|uniref:hypothetical protein n=1 Tax=Niastella sp. OAS944 TaxID=2664089 RepID=UPI0034871510|nr:hypothetical protein [Chitinophagaceae bacterium OAS944]
MYNAIFRDSLAVPRGWGVIRSILFSRGWTGKQPNDISSNDPVYTKLIIEIFSKTYTVSGIPFAPRLYPIALTIALAALGFLMLGPTLILYRNKPETSNDSWIMLLAMTGWRGKMLWTAQLMAALFCTLMPAVTGLLSLIFIGPFLEGWQYALLVLCAIGTIFTSIILGICSKIFLTANLR